MSVARFLLCLGLAAAAPVSAQVVSESNREAGQALLTRWSAGIAATAREGVYAGEDHRTQLFPNVSYEGERVYWRSVQAGVHLLTREHAVLDVYVAGRFDGVDADDFGADALARRGIDRNRLDDRDDAADIGASVLWRGRLGELELDLRHDVTDTSGGGQASMAYRRPIHAGDWMVTPKIGARWLSADLADYYYGIHDREVARGLTAYRPGSVVVPHAGLTAVRPFAGRWLLIASMEYRRLPSALRGSPLVASGTSGGATTMVGVSRGF